MRGQTLALIALILLTGCLTGCDRDPARSVKIISRPPLAGADAAPPARVLNWHPDACPPLPETERGPSSISVSGPCPFTHTGTVKCVVQGDDVLIIFSREAKDGSRLTLHLNVESYHGPGTYDKSNMALMVSELASNRWYRWSNENITATVGPEVAYVDLPPTELSGEPMLSNCARKLGQSENYQYQCTKILDAATTVESTTERVSGRFQCEKPDQD